MRRALPFSLAVTLALLGAAGCAPSTLAPTIIRVTPGDPTKTSGMIGVRTGPRVSVPLATTGSFSGGFAGDSNSFSVPQLSVAYDLGLTKPVTRWTALHVGAQGEFYYPFPLPGYGVYGGISHLIQVGSLVVTPAVAVRGATDFGLSSIGGPGTFAGGEASMSIAWRPEEKVAIGIVPFVNVQHLWTAGTETNAVYAGAVLVGHIETSVDTYELMGGFGRVFMPNVSSWNAPIIGLRAGR